MNFDYLNFNRQPLRFTKVDGIAHVSLSDVLNILNITRPNDIETVKGSIITEYGFNPIELVSVMDALELVKSSIKSNPQLIKVLSQKC
ncbi:hypothetical protein VSS37_02915 [Candidatus Thiothrix sp. Deng01]|uniref:Uncharacterized protein n=1 Tax=Candidatus Thiothrix phosphatis TaxID=3112415 RepID=A0ABU6CSX0_9GAMM|nr:hypothetical protein [Candidatus Thiothrix sp. Deng01]MEB4589921.1 hypothetical protein [Candidatus Thiothrix sp. Deng01]